MNDIIIQNTAIHAEAGVQELSRSEKIQKLFREYADLTKKLKTEKSILSEFYRNDIEYSRACDEIKNINAEKKVAKARIEAREIDTCNNITELSRELNQTKEILNEMITYEVIDRAKKQEPNPMQMSLFDKEGTAYSPMFSVSFTQGLPLSETQSDKEDEAAKPEQTEYFLTVA